MFLSLDFNFLKFITDDEKWILYYNSKKIVS